MQLEYYLSLLQLHIAVIGVVIAGIVALVQILNNAKPHRDIRLLIRKRILASYGLLLVGLLLVLAFGAWASAFPGQAQASFGAWCVSFFNDGRVALIVIILSLTSLMWFGQLAVRIRTLLDSQTYLQKYVQATPARQVRQYLAAIYQQPYTGQESRLRSASDRKRAVRAPIRQVIPFDPFQPIREYTKDNAFKYYDYGTADGLKHFSNLFDKTFKSIHKQSGANEQEEYLRLARYMSENASELFMIFAKTASEKRKMDIIGMLHTKGEMLLVAGNDASLLPIVRGLENIARLSDDDDEIIAAIECIRRLSDSFLDGHSKHDWAHVAGPFDEICLSVARITETYYLQKNNSLKTVPIIGYSTGEHRTVTAALVDFFCAYQDLGDRYTDTRPVLYFETIESVIEVLFIRLGDVVASGQQSIGFNMKYHELANSLYDIYYTFGIDAIEHDNPELLTLSLSNLRRIIKPAKNFALTAEHTDIVTIIVELAIKGITKFGAIAIKDKRTIGDYAVETLTKHATAVQIDAAIRVMNLKEAEAASLDMNAPGVKQFIKRLRPIQH